MRCPIRDVGNHMYNPGSIYLNDVAFLVAPPGDSYILLKSTAVAPRDAGATSKSMGNITIVLIFINAVPYSVDIFSDQAYGSARSLPILDDRIGNQSDGSRGQIGVN